MRRWARDLALGVRLSVAGGRSGWARLAMITAGVGLGVAMLLISATIPAVLSARNDRTDARVEGSTQSLPRADDTLLIDRADSEYQEQKIYGRLVQPEGSRPPRPPGVDRLPAPGEMIASPALARLLASDEGALLRGRWGDRVVGTIGAAGLSGPDEYAFYLGTDDLNDESAFRVNTFGQPGQSGAVDPVLLLLGAVALIVLLVPVAIFVATAVRFGGESRDRRLAALRLVGADTAMTRRIASGETLAGALLGLLVGGLLSLVVGLLALRFVPSGLSFYRDDLRPVPVLVALVVVLVPVGAVLVTLSALRRVMVEPLGVVRLSSDSRRRLWWRLVLPVLGLVLLYPLHAGMEDQSEGFEYQVMAGVAALLVGVALLLPWVVEALVRRLGGGGVAWELAVRRLQLDSGTAVRAVSGIAVSVAGVIALQGLLAAVQAQYTLETGRTADHFQVQVLPQVDEPTGGWVAALDRTPGVRAVDTVTWWSATPTGSGADARLTVGDCAVLRQQARIDSCSDGDTFVVAKSGVPTPRAGTVYGYDLEDDTAAQWTLPAGARTVTTQDALLQSSGSEILITPAALGRSPLFPSVVDVYAALDPADPTALDQLRNSVAQVDPTAYVALIQARSVEAVMLNIRTGLLVGAVALLLLIGASQLVNVVEQLRERRRLLAVLVAFGTRRSTLSGSVLYQVAVPVLLGLTLAVATGMGLASILQVAADAPIRFDWSGMAITSGAAALVVLATTAASLPLLWRLTTPAGLRSE